MCEFRSPLEKEYKQAGSYFLCVCVPSNLLMTFYVIQYFPQSSE